MGDLAPIAGFDTFLDQEYRHFAFIPKPLPNNVELAARTVKIIAEAERSLGRLDAATGRLPNPDLLVRPSLYREAVSTSALEGTYAPLDSVMQAEYVEEKDRTEEEREILNYVKAAQRGLELLDTKPICLTLIAELQAILVQGTRGDSYDAGRLRERQVYIGRETARHRGIPVRPPRPRRSSAGRDE